MAKPCSHCSGALLSSRETVSKTLALVEIAERDIAAIRREAAKSFHARRYYFCCESERNPYDAPADPPPLARLRP